MMKVLYILHSTIMGGATISFMNMLSGLIEKGIEPVIIGPKANSEDVSEDFEKYIEQRQIRYYEALLPMQVWPQVNSCRRKLFFPARLVSFWVKTILGKRTIKRILKSENPDIVHTNVGVIHIGAILSKKMNIPHVWHIREYQDKDFEWSIYPSKRKFMSHLKSSSYVISITQDLINYFGLSNNTNARCVYNGILHKSETYYQSKKKKYFLCASRIDKEKGHKDVIKAFSVFVRTNPDYELVILGFGSEYFIHELKELSNEMGCSYSEGFGRMTAEAYLSGCLPIGRDTAGTKEILDLVGGYRFETIEGLVDCMNSVVSLDEVEYRRQALAIQKKAAERFSIEANIEGVYSIYESLIEDKKNYGD